jgi:hypothetical protein
VPGETRKTFVIPHIIEASGRISNVAVGDFNGDGTPDLLTFDPDISSLELLQSTRIRESPTLPSLGKTRLKQGDGSHVGVGHVFVWSSVADLATGDVDGDGALDFVALDASSGRFCVCPRSPDREGFRSPIAFAIPGQCNRVALGDLDGDGDLDVACLDETAGQLVLCTQTSSSPLTFTVDASPPVIGACRGLVLLDLDRDGKLDCVTNRYAADGIAVWARDAGGILSPRDVASGLPTGRAMGIGDVDGDGWPDVVLVSEDGRSLVCLHQRSSAPGFFDVFVSDLGMVVSEEGIEACQIAIDEPGVHLHVRESPSRPSQGCHLRESPTRASAGKTARVSMTQPGLALADFDRDGHLDVLVSPGGGDPDFDLLMIYGIRESPTRFGPIERAPGSGKTGSASGKRQHVAVADLDGDGHSDLITGDPDFDLLRLCYTASPVAPTNPSFVELFRESPTRQSTGLVSVDLDRDGLLDLVCPTPSGIDLRFLDPASPGTYAPPVTLAPVQSFVSVAVGDVNGDGCPDLITALPQSLVTVLRDPATPRGFLPPIPFPQPPVGGNFRSLAVADVDQDGHLDCVAVRESPSKASMCRGQGNGFFDVFTEIDVGVTSPRGVAVGDLNGDGRPDLVVCGDGPDGSAVVMRSIFGPTVWELPVALAFQGGVRVAVGDVDGDGRADIVTTGQPGCIVSLQDATRRGSFHSSYALSTEPCGGLDLVDLDRDGLLDVCFVECPLGTLVCTTGDPDFDLLRSVSLNGLPPGVPWEGIFVAAGDVDGDGRCDLVTACPSRPGAPDGVVLLFGGQD